MVWDEVLDGVQWILGCRNSISFSNHSWLSSGSILKDMVVEDIPSNLIHKTMDQMVGNDGSWNLNEVLHLLPHSAPLEIAGSPTPSPLPV